MNKMKLLAEWEYEPVKIQGVTRKDSLRQC